MDYQNNAFVPGMVPNMAPYGAAQQAQMNARENWLTDEQIALLQRNDQQFTIQVSDADIARAQCRHLVNGQSTLVQDPETGGWVCTCCGQKFSAHDWTKEEIVSAKDSIVDILNMIKVMYLSMDKNVGLQYFGIIPLIEKIPQLYEAAAADFKKYEGVSTFAPGPSMNPFALFNRMMNPGMAYGPAMYGQPQAPYAQPMNYGYQQPQMNPAYNPLYGQPQAPNTYQPQANGFAMNPQGASAPMGAPMYYQAPAAQPAAPQPQQQNFGFNPNMPIQPAAPAAPETQAQAPAAAPAAPTPAKKK